MHSSSIVPGLSVVVVAQPSTPGAGPTPSPAPAGRTEVIGAPSAPTPAGGEAKQLVPTGAPAAQPSPAGSMLFLLLPLVLLVALMVFGSMSQRKEQRRRRELLASVQRNDRVQTIGGVIGTVAELTDDEIVLRVDEASNTRVRFSRSAVQQVLRKAGGASSQAEAKLSADARVGV